jgi:hypothetical protein
VTNITIYSWGAGGSVSGAYVHGVAYTTPGELLRVTVGGRGDLREQCGFAGTLSGYGSDHGGGLSGIARLIAGTIDTYDYLLVAGGGGGRGYSTNGQPGQGINPAGCGTFSPKGLEAVTCCTGSGGGGGGWKGGASIDECCNKGAYGGTSCAPGVLPGTVISLPGTPASPPNTGSPFYVPGAGGPGGSGLVVLQWWQPDPSPSGTPSRTPTPSRSRSLSATATPTASATSLATRSVTATATVSPYCAPSVYRTFTYRSFDGEPAGAPQLLTSERDCQRACCDVPGCEAYTFDSNTVLLGGSWAACYFLRNVTQIVPNPLVASGLKYANNS